MPSSAARQLSILILSSLAMSMGCDRLPTTARNETIAVPAGALVEKGRGGYDWRLDIEHGTTALEILRPTSFKFVQDLDDDLIKQNYKALKYVESSGQTKPEWMDDDIYQWVRRFTEAHPEPKVVLEVPVDAETGQQAFAVSLDGQRMVTVGTKLIEWEIASGKRLHEFPAPLDHCLQVAYGHHPRQVLISNKASLIRVDLDTGTTLATWPCHTGDLQVFATARKADVVVVLPGDQRMIALRDGFRTELRYQGEKLLSNSIAIEPEGRWVLGATEGKLIRWRPSRSGQQIDSWDDDQLDPSIVATCGEGYDRWCNVNGIRQYNHATRQFNKRGKSTIATLTSFPWHAANASMPGGHDWLVVFAETGNFDGTTQRIVQDFGTMRASVPWVIPIDGIEAVSGDQSMQTIAFRTAKAIQVYHRRAWVDVDGTLASTEVVGKLMQEGRLEQLEMLLEHFRAQPVLRGNITGEEYYGELVDKVSKAWQRIEENPQAVEQKDKLEQWRQQGSLHARLCSAAKNLEMAAKARGEDSTDTVTDEGWRVMKERNSLALAELTPIVNEPHPPATALFIMTNVMRYASTPVAQQEAILKKSIELYPNQHLILTSICYTLLPRWGGTEGEGGALVAAVATHYPEPYGDILYARVMLDMSRTFGRNIFPEAGFSEHRAARAAEPLMEIKKMFLTETECLMEIAANVGDQTLLEKIGRYHLQTFPWISAFAGRHGPDSLFQMRLDSRR